MTTNSVRQRNKNNSINDRCNCMAPLLAGNHKSARQAKTSAPRTKKSEDDVRLANSGAPSPLSWKWTPPRGNFAGHRSILRPRGKGLEQESFRLLTKRDTSTHGFVKQLRLIVLPPRHAALTGGDSCFAQVSVLFARQRRRRGGTIVSLSYCARGETRISMRAWRCVYPRRFYPTPIVETICGSIHLMRLCSRAGTWFPQWSTLSCTMTRLVCKPCLRFHAVHGMLVWPSC